ncbi:MAG: hypothetical protein IMY73_00510 [Bacteroidetes bacterium]|nr:hypothetical protein [Bacteroidota bacterium]
MTNIKETKIEKKVIDTKPSNEPMYIGKGGLPGDTTEQNFKIHNDANESTYSGGMEALSNRAGVVYNTTNSENKGEYANFTKGNSGFQISSADTNSEDFFLRKKTRSDSKWGDFKKIYHSGNLDTPLANQPNTTSDKESKYDSTNSIHTVYNGSKDSKVISFANKEKGLQFEAETSHMYIPGQRDKTSIKARIKRSNKLGYNDWVELYHSGNLDLTSYAKKTELIKKADKNGTFRILNGETTNGDSLGTWENSDSEKIVSFADDNSGLQIAGKVEGENPTLKFRVKESNGTYSDWAKLGKEETDTNSPKLTCIGKIGCNGYMYNDYKGKRCESSPIGSSIDNTYNVRTIGESFNKPFVNVTLCGNVDTINKTITTYVTSLSSLGFTVIVDVKDKDGISKDYNGEILFSVYE